LLFFCAVLFAGAGLAHAQYPTYSQFEAELLNAESNYPLLCQRQYLGNTEQGRQMWALCITDNVGVEEDEPEFKYISTMHGDEVTGMVMCLNLIDYLTTNYGSISRVTNIVDSVELWIVPCMNPDGYELGWRNNANQVNLNRDFPDPYTSPNNTPAGREAETGNIMNWSFGRSFTLAANYHGGALVANYPFDTNASGSSVYTPSPDDDLFIWISKEYTRHNLPMWNSPYFNYGITNGADWYAINGGMQDWSYLWMGCNEITIEVSQTKTPPYSQMPTFWNENRESMLAFIETCLIGVRGVVTDAVTGDPLAATVTVGGRDHDVYTDPDVGDYHRMLLPGAYDLTFAADGYDPYTEYGVIVSSGSATRLDVALANTTLTYPNGGETFTVGVEAIVTWTGNPNAQFHVQYSANPGDIDSVVDGFESGALDPAYNTGGNRGWIVTDTVSYDGYYSARAGDIADGEVSWMTRSVEGGDLSFWYRVSSESCCDFFDFYIDSDRVIRASGTSGGWTQYITTLSPGPHELKWEYNKDVSLSYGSDTAWVDELEIVTDNTTWTDIIALTDVGAMSTPWTPVVPGTDYLVRSRSYYGNTYGSWDESDSTFTVLAVEIPGDFDADGDVDFADYSAFADCFTGPDGGPVGLECTPGDFPPQDGDVDCDDWVQFLLAWTVPDEPPTLAACAQTIPTVSAWGMLIMVLLVWTMGTIIVRLRILDRRLWIAHCRLDQSTIGNRQSTIDNRQSLEGVPAVNNSKLIALALCVVAWPCVYCHAAGRSPLHTAAAAGNLQRIQEALANSPEQLNVLDASGKTPLHLALGKLHVEAAEMLLAAGANPNVRDRDASPALHTLLGVARGKKEAPARQRSLLALMLGRGADIQAVDGHGKAPLHIAAVTGHEALLDMLLGAGAKVTTKDRIGRTPLHDAALYNSTSAIGRLLSDGANVNAADKHGNTPLHCAVLRFRREAAGQLIAGGAEVDAVDNRGRTPLHLAGAQGPEEKEVDRLLTAVAELLLEAGADVNARDKEGFTPLHHALEKNREELAELLRHHGGHD
jgi:carboxypeptidase D